MDAIWDAKYSHFEIEGYFLIQVAKQPQMGIHLVSRAFRNKVHRLGHEIPWSGHLGDGKKTGMDMGLFLISSGLGNTKRSRTIATPVPNAS